MWSSAFLVSSVVLAAAGDRPSPEQALAAVRRAVGRSNAAQLHALLSDETLAYVCREFGRDRVDAAVNLMLERLRSGLPLRVVRRRVSETAVYFDVEGPPERGTAWRSELRFVPGSGAWKLDLVRDLEAWKRLTFSVRKVMVDMQRAAPYPGKERPADHP